MKDVVANSKLAVDGSSPVTTSPAANNKPATDNKLAANKPVTDNNSCQTVLRLVTNSKPADHGTGTMNHNTLNLVWVDKEAVDKEVELCEVETGDSDRT